MTQTIPAKPERTLAPLQHRFVEGFLLDLKATAAYPRAGYMAKNDNVAAVSGHHLLKNPKIREAIQYAFAARSRRPELSQGVVLNALWAAAEEYGAGAPRLARVRAAKIVAEHLGLLPGRVGPLPPFQRRAFPFIFQVPTSSTI